MSRQTMEDEYFKNIFENIRRREERKRKAYIPTPEELKGESYGYCYGSTVVIPPPTDDNGNPV